MDPTTRLRIATRIHFGLMRHFGEDVEISTLLKSESEAREVIWVCEASGDADLMALARQFKRASRKEAAPVQAAGRVAQDTAWSKDTSGFGVSRPIELEHPSAGSSSGWFNPASWLRRGPARAPR